MTKSAEGITKKFSVLLLALLAAVCFAASAPAAEKYEIKYAKKFSVEYRENNVKLVTDTAGKHFLLVPRGEKIPEDYKNMKETMIVRTPVKRAVLCSTSQGSFYNLLDPSGKIFTSVAAVSTEAKDWMDNPVRELMEKGRIEYIPSSMGQEPSVEKIMTLKADIVFPSGMNLGESKMSLQLKGAGVPTLSVGDYTEASEEAYLEWIKFYAAFYNMDEAADKIFEKIVSEKKALVAKIEKEIKKGNLKRPTVALGFLFKGLVYTQSGEGKFTDYIHNAGGSYVLSENKINGSVQIGMEEFFNKCKNADILIYSSSPKYTPDKKALIAQNELFAEFKAMKTGNVYLYDEGYYVHSAEIKEKFEDMVFILQPSLLPGHKLRHYIKLSD